MTKTRFRIYTEYIHSRHIAEIVDKYFADYSMFTGIGHCDHIKERCLVIEIIIGFVEGKGDGHNEVFAICQEINTANDQKCCLVTAESVDVMTVTERMQPV